MIQLFIVNDDTLELHMDWMNYKLVKNSFSLIVTAKK